MNNYIVFIASIVATASIQGQYHGRGLDTQLNKRSSIINGITRYANYYTEPHFYYDYNVQDRQHQDYKYQWETRNGDKVKGEYSFMEPDGTNRIVSYEADNRNGFNAVVKHVTNTKHPQNHNKHTHHRRNIE